MNYTVRVWDCRVKTDEPCRTRRFKTWAEAIEYIKTLPDHEGGTITYDKN